MTSVPRSIGGAGVRGGGGEDFRKGEIKYLQEQNYIIFGKLEEAEEERAQAHEQIRSCEEKDFQLQAELQSERDQIEAFVSKATEYKSETIKKDEHVKVLAEQNKQMLSLLEAEEIKAKERQERIHELEARNRKLQKVADMFDTEKADIERKVSDAKASCAEILASVKSQRTLNESLRANIQSTEAKTRVELEALGQALQVVDQKNLEYLARINKQESKEQQLQADTEVLKEEVETVRSDIDALRKQLQGDEEGRTAFERARGQMETSIQALEVQADTFKKALSTAERANEQLQEENRTAGERSRETADKVYALMDSLRLNQVELTKQEAENKAREKKILSLERQIQQQKAKISMETDARVLADEECKEAEQESNLLKKKNRTIEERVTASQQAQERAEKEISTVNEKVSQLQTENAFLASRIDGQDEEKNSLRAEIKKVSDNITDLASDNSKLRDEIDRLEENVANMNLERQQLVQELEYIKREDLDEAGRKRPILIQSAESDLLEKLQINEFLFEAQQARNPIPPLIEKIAQLLAMLHDGQQRSDQYLNDLSKSNALVSALRQRNVSLFSRTQMFESFKTRALLRYVMNLVEGELITDLHLDSLSFGPREINEMISLLQRYDATDKVFVISLVDNGLDDDATNLLLQLVFTLPYLKSLDLRRNCIGPDSVKRIEEQIKVGMDGVTSVVRTTAQVLNVHSGNQVRLCINVSEQLPKEVVAKEIDFTVHQELAHADADPFLATDAGKSDHPWTQTAAAKMKSPAPQQPVPDPSTIDISKPTQAPVAPQVGGPPVGLGGPGNVAALNKRAAVNKAGRDRVPDPKRRQSRRAKAAPPPPLGVPEYVPDQRVLDKWQAASVPMQNSSSSTLPGSSGSMRRSKSQVEPVPHASRPDPYRLQPLPSAATTSHAEMARGHTTAVSGSSRPDAPTNRSGSSRSSTIKESSSMPQIRHSQRSGSLRRR